MMNASGGSWVIPPGYPNESYRFPDGRTASSGEVVTVTPAGQGGAAGVVIQNVYLTSTLDLESFKRMLVKVLAG